MRRAVEEEGFAGIKRSRLSIRLDQIESDLGRLINNLVELRTDLKVSQQE